MPGKNSSYPGETRFAKPDKGPLEHIHCPPDFSKEILKNEKED
jgi:hypothetical protein